MEKPTLAIMATGQIRQGLGTVALLPTEETWYGATYRDDLQTVQAAVADMKRRGVYPAELWRA